MSKDTIDSAFIISYVPLLRGKAGEIINLDAKTLPARIKDIYDNYIDTDIGSVKGCAWFMSEEDGDLGIAFAVKNAAEIHEHLVAWAEGVPQRWFDLCLYDTGNRYVIALMPNFARSVERFKEVNQIVNSIKVADDAKFELIFKPLTFISNPDPPNFYKIKDRLESRIQIGLVDPNKLKVGMKADDVFDLGRFTLYNDKYIEYLAGTMK